MNAEHVALMALAACFSGYVAGRIGHYYVNDWLNNPAWSFHHWIYGYGLVVGGVSSNYLIATTVGAFVFAFGAGHFISDIKDFFEKKVRGPDEEGEKRFWHID